MAAAAMLIAALPASAAPNQLKYVVIVTRHGVRSPTWSAERLDQYSAQPWPDWGVAPGDLTPHGRELIKLIGSYYRDWLTGEHLLARNGCMDSARIYIWADKDQRTVETGRALAESLAPGCAIATHHQDGKSDPLFEGVGAPDPDLLRSSVRDRLGADPQKVIDDHRAAFDALKFVLNGSQSPASDPFNAAARIGVSVRNRSVDLDGPLSAASSLSEDFLLEYANGMQGKDLGWGRLTKANLFQILELHEAYTELIRRTPYVARAKGSNLLEHVLRSMEQAATGKPVAGAMGHPGDVLLVLSGHDTNLSNISGMLDLSWTLPGYQPNDTPPGGALIFSLWQDDHTRNFVVKTQYVAQTLDQMREATPLALKTPPSRQDVFPRGCRTAGLNAGNCSWPAFKAALQQAINPRFTEVAPESR